MLAAAALLVALSVTRAPAAARAETLACACVSAPCSAPVRFVAGGTGGFGVALSRGRLRR